MHKTSMIGILMVVGLVSLLMAPPASGQTIAKFNVPFEFVAGDRVLPAGEYRVTWTAASGASRSGRQGRTTALS